MFSPTADGAVGKQEHSAKSTNKFGLQRETAIVSDSAAESKFMLEIDYSSLLRSSFDRQSYWVRAMKAARQAGRRVATLQRNNGAGARRRQAKRASRRTEKRATVDTTDIERQIHNDTVLVAGTSRSRPHPAAIEALNPCNKRLRHPD